MSDILMLIGKWQQENTGRSFVISCTRSPTTITVSLIGYNKFAASHWLVYPAWEDNLCELQELIEAYDNA